MGKRIRLGLIFLVDENWIGGTYYILNLIKALGALPKKDQPVITILSKSKTDFYTAQKTGYQYLQYKNPFDLKRTLAEAAINKLMRFFLKADIDKRISKKDIDVVFPAINTDAFSLIDSKIYWFPDFQHLYFPDFFSPEELKRRELMLKEIAASGRQLVLSSESAKKDWTSLNLPAKCTVYTIPFAVSHPVFDHLDLKNLYAEFNIEQEYFIISNQFWKHKNHLLVLKAIVALEKKYSHYQFLFTGKKGNPNTDTYFKTITNFINQHNLNGKVIITGLIDRNKQLKLMKHAKAVIQPSLFEGWSTVIEDAKAMAKVIIASDIPVHREQLFSGNYFFDPHSETDLAEKIIAVIENPQPAPMLNYQENIVKFGKQFEQVMQLSYQQSH